MQRLALTWAEGFSAYLTSRVRIAQACSQFVLAHTAKPNRPGTDET